jgi:hypothetical protein
MGLTAAVVGGGMLLGTGAQMYGASEAAGAQRGAARESNALQREMFNTSRADLAPFRGFGERSGNMLLDMMPELTRNFNPTMSELENTPGYKFTLNQGLKAVDNANSVKGWGGGGAGMKAITDYASGLASQTFQQQFENYWKQNTNKANMLLEPMRIGGNAAAQQGQINTQVGGNMGANLVGAGNATAASYMGMGNAVANAPTNALMSYRMLDQTMNPEKYGMMFGSGYGGGYGGAMGYGTQYSMGGAPL